MSQAHAAVSRPETAGQVILVVTSAVAALLVIAGLIYATGNVRRSQATLAAAGCEPGTGSETGTCTTQPMLARQYTAVLTPANRQFSIEVAAYTANEGHDLGAAEAALSAEVTTEQALGASLAGITFPPAMTPIAQTLIRADLACARLTAEQAGSSSLAQMRSFNLRVQAAGAAVRTEMDLLLKAVDTPIRAG